MYMICVLLAFYYHTMTNQIYNACLTQALPTRAQVQRSSRVLCCIVIFVVVLLSSYVICLTVFTFRNQHGNYTNLQVAVRWGYMLRCVLSFTIACGYIPSFYHLRKAN